MHTKTTTRMRMKFSPREYMIIGVILGADDVV